MKSRELTKKKHASALQKFPAPTRGTRCGMLVCTGKQDLVPEMRGRRSGNVVHEMGTKGFLKGKHHQTLG